MVNCHDSLLLNDNTKYIYYSSIKSKTLSTVKNIPESAMKYDNINVLDDMNVIIPYRKKIR